MIGSARRLSGCAARRSYALRGAVPAPTPSHHPPLTSRPASAVPRPRPARHPPPAAAASAAPPAGAARTAVPPPFAPQRAHQCIDVAQPVDQPDLQRSLAQHEAAVEQRRLVALQPAAAPRPHPVLEPDVQRIQQVLHERHVLRILRTERIEPRLVRPGGIEPPLHPDPRQQIGKAEAAAAHPDRPHDAHRVGVDLVGRAGQPVAARRAHLADHRHTRSLCSSARRRISEAIRSDCTGDPPGLSMSMITGRPCAERNARLISGVAVAADSMPGRAAISPCRDVGR